MTTTPETDTAEAARRAGIAVDRIRISVFAINSFMASVAGLGGSISAEHGIGQMKRDELARLLPPARLHAMRAIKAALDPLGIMNPGKLVPLAPEPGGK